MQTHLWCKTNQAPNAGDRRLKAAFEYMWHFAKGPGYHFDKDAIREPHLWAGRDARKERYHPAGKDPGNVILPLADRVNAAKSGDDDVIVMPKSHDQKAFGHPGKMREGLATRFIKLLTAPDDLVVDGFNGTGQTGVEALALGRRYVGYEIHADRAEAARQRLGVEQDVQEVAAVEQKIMTVRQCARYIGRTEDAVRAMVKRAQIPFGRLGSSLVFDREHIDRWLRESVAWVMPQGFDPTRPNTPEIP